MQNRPNQQQLLNWINMVSFAVQEAVLYLDTHTDDKEAIKYYNHFSKLRNEALEEYATRFTPLTVDSIKSCEQEWKWAKDKWPWEKGGC